ncbi:conserved hypothetical protein [Lodderomyces elongisporus NRRL YB-4239]|uniref:Smr domain-containing protein n=1 Tax=Lodderomyces elongisporus (strain ATCC 11503 / CBS 2605 / JCM 1781 / NBRC 1676 / NRRL YB-4239) TaxID=379508 RepID=A5DYH7_LODEL|nr:conserved hypothetical protein [Lodderomyces elongisporus NRRL YB-4239]
MTDVLDRGVKLSNDNERDYNHATDSEYKRLRAKADEYYKKRNALSQQSQAAYKQKDGQRAHELSEELKKALAQAEQYSQQAAEYVFRENNADSAADEIDLHGLYVKEAEWILKVRLKQAISTNQSHLKVIVGKGLHSQNGIAKLKPAVDQLCDETRLKHYIDPKNSGVMIIELNGEDASNIPTGWGSGTITQPQQAYHGNNQPHYQQQQHQQQQQQQLQYQQQHHQNQNQNQNFKTGNQLLDLLLKGLCMCINSK